MAGLGCRDVGNVVTQDRQFELPDRRPGLQAQFLIKDASRALIGGEGIRLAMCAVQREHELSQEPLAERMATDEGLHLIDELRTRATCEVGIDPGFEG